MDVLKDTLLCRLCGVNIDHGKYKCIFDGSVNLLQKIKETLPISVSMDDSGSKYVCLLCYDKIIFHYTFIQEVVNYSKGVENILQKKPLSVLSKDVTELSEIHSDAVYACPNCNVDLMIFLVSNPQACEYTFQISLAVVNNSRKKHIPKNENIQQQRNVASPNSKKNNVYLKHENKATIPKNTETESEHVSLILPVLPQEESLSYTEALTDKSKIKIEVQEQLKTKHLESNFSQVPVRLSKDVKHEELHVSSGNFLNCDYHSAETLPKNGDVSDNTHWLDSDIDCRSEKEDTTLIKSQNTNIEIDNIEDDSDTYKSCLKYVCKLCGARYLSRMKYEFHMERHRLHKIVKYECTICNKETSNENLLWDHYFQMHKNSQRYICIECGKLFTKQSKLNGHQKHYNHLGIRQIQIGTSEDTINQDIIEESESTTMQEQVSVNCNLCGKIISDLDPDAINDLVTCTNCDDSTLSLMVDGNEAKVISPRQYHCSMCPKHFVRKERLEFHEMRHNENMNEFVCSTCGKEFRAENSLYEHYLFVHKGARPHICELCGKSFQLKARLKEHHRVHTGERPYQCDICGQRCRTTNALKLHRKIHFSHNRYSCNICNKSFTKKQNMNEHLEKHWKNDKSIILPQLFTCPICTEDFPTYRMLRYHMIEVHEINSQDPILVKQKPWYECAECNEKFKHQMSLKAHKERVHEGRVDPIYRCDICNATYKVKQLLVNHIKSKHNGERRYKCAQCEKGFNDTKSLYNHVLLHTGKKPFVCEYCNMSFRRKDSRDHHRRKHTGEQPYQCPDCGESFSTYNNRSKHRKREHETGDPECPECGEKCCNQQEIRIHLNKHLGEKLKELQDTI